MILGAQFSVAGHELELDPDPNPQRALTVIVVASLWGPDMLASKILLRGCILNKIRERRNAETQHFRLRFGSVPALARPGQEGRAEPQALKQWFKVLKLAKKEF